MTVAPTLRVRGNPRRPVPWAGVTGVLLTSARAADFFSRAWPSPWPKGVALWAVGPATAQAIRLRGWPLTGIGPGPGAASLARVLPRIQGQTFLHPCGAKADPELETILRRKGARVLRWEIYRTEVRPLPASLVRRVLQGSFALGVFASPSAWEGFAASFASTRPRTLGEHLGVVALGPTTARTIRRDGVKPQVASSTQVQDVVRAAKSALAKRKLSSLLLLKGELHD